MGHPESSQKSASLHTPTKNTHAMVEKGLQAPVHMIIAKTESHVKRARERPTSGNQKLTKEGQKAGRMEENKQKEGGEKKKKRIITQLHMTY